MNRLADVEVQCIMSWCSVRDAVSFARTSKRCYSVAQKPSTWYRTHHTRYVLLNQSYGHDSEQYIPGPMHPSSPLTLPIPLYVQYHQNMVNFDWEHLLGGRRVARLKPYFSDDKAVCPSMLHTLLHPSIFFSLCTLDRLPEWCIRSVPFANTLVRLPRLHHLILTIYRAYMDQALWLALRDMASLRSLDVSFGHDVRDSATCLPALVAPQLTDLTVEAFWDWLGPAATHFPELPLLRSLTFRISSYCALPDANVCASEDDVRHMARCVPQLRTLDFYYIGESPLRYLHHFAHLEIVYLRLTKNCGTPTPRRPTAELLSKVRTLNPRLKIIIHS